MSEQPDDHTLNACLARVIGRVVETVDKPSTSVDDGGSVELVPGHWYIKRGHSINFDAIEWDPVHDANQMELVEAWLWENDIHIVYVWDGKNHHWDLMPQVKFSKIYRAYDPDKKRAFALAIYAMEQSQKEK